MSTYGVCSGLWFGVDRPKKAMIKSGEEDSNKTSCMNLSKRKHFRERYSYEALSRRERIEQTLSRQRNHFWRFKTHCQERIEFLKDGL
jgi:hypothetical protein